MIPSIRRTSFAAEPGRAQAAPHAIIPRRFAHPAVAGALTTAVHRARARQSERKRDPWHPTSTR